MEILIGIIISLCIMTFISSKLYKEIKTPEWKWTPMTIGVGLIYVAIYIVLIYHLITLIFK